MTTRRSGHTVTIWQPEKSTGDPVERMMRLLAGEDRDWQDLALCAQADPEAFFPERGAAWQQAKKVCAACEVRAECLEYALEHDERFGIWGGTSEHERRNLRRDRARQEAA